MAITLDGNSNVSLLFSSGGRVTGDFTNATLLSRAMFQTSTANSTTGIYALPSGTATAASWQATNAADPTNASKVLIATNGSTDCQLVSGRNGTGTYLPLTFYTNGSEQMRLDSSGNLGLGVTPSAWNSVYRAFDFGSLGGIASAANTVGIYTNVYIDSAFNSKYKTTNYATSYLQNSNGTGQHQWFIAPSGSAGGTISFTQAMTLDASGNLTISGATATKASGTTWANPSDTRLKDNQQNYDKGLSELLQISVKTWEFNGKGGSSQGVKGIGVIADEVESILPDSVDTYRAKLNDFDEEETDIKRFDASEVIWLLVKSVQELSAELNELKAKVNA